MIRPLFPLRLVLALLAAAGLLACRKAEREPGGGGRKPPVPVLAATAAAADVPVELQAIGAAEAVQSTPVRAQIGGPVVDVRFREGDFVAAGQVLFQLDARPQEAVLRQLQADLSRLEAQARNADAQVRAAEAQLRNAEAQAQYAEAQAKRYEELVLKDFVTKADYDQRRTAEDAGRAGVDAGRAALEASRASAQAAADAARATRATIENARLQLAYLTIRAPVSGQTGSLLARRGDLVKANDAPLVVVNQLDPIRVRFTVPEARLPDVQRYRKEGTLRVVVTPPGKPEPRAGRLVFVDNAVDPATATIALKGEFGNADRALWPGQLLDVTLALTTRRDAVVVPSQAVQTGQQGPYLFVVGPDGTASVRPVAPGLAAGDRTIIEKGLAAGETVVTDGQLKLTPGAKVAVRQGLGAPPSKGPAAQQEQGRAP